MRIVKQTDNKKKYIDLLLLADEGEEMIDRYLDRGEMYIALDPEPVGECVVLCEDGVCEIKNLAVYPEHQGKGYGRALVDFVVKSYEGFEITVGTGESPLTLPFYEKCGFKIFGRVENFFTDNYDHEMCEGGVVLRDMIYLRYEKKALEGAE